MDPIALHLRLNHLPIMAAALAVPLLVLAFLRSNPRDLLLSASVVLSLGLVGAIVSLRSGEGAEDRLEQISEAPESLIEEHEERAEPATIALGIATAIAWITFGVSVRRAPPRVLSAVALASSVVAAGFMVWTAAAGGKIAHEEMRGTEPVNSRSSDSHGES